MRWTSRRGGCDCGATKGGVRVCGVVSKTRLPVLLLILAACDPADDGGAGASSVGAEGTSGEMATTAETSDAGPGTTDDPGTAGDAPGDDTGAPPICGDGVLDPGEVCDGEAGVDVDCVVLGWVAGSVTCATDCLSLDESGCSATAVCGDGELSEGEACEGESADGPGCAEAGAGSGAQSCLDCQWSVATCCDTACIEGCDATCGADPADLTGTWTILFYDNGWSGPDPTMIMTLEQTGEALSGSFTTDAWYLGDHEFEGGTRTGNDVYMHVPITQLEGGMIMEGTVCGACTMRGVTDPQGGLNSAWIATRS